MIAKHGDQRGGAADRADLVARHLPEDLAVAAHGEEQDDHVLHGAGEDHADDDPDRARQIAHLRGEHRADERAGAGDRGEVVAEQHAPVGRLEVDVVLEPLGGRRALVVDPQHLVGDEARVEAVGDRVRADRGDDQPRRARSARRGRGRSRPRRPRRPPRRAVQIAIDRVRVPCIAPASPGLVTNVTYPSPAAAIGAGGPRGPRAGGRAASASPPRRSRRRAARRARASACSCPRVSSTSSTAVSRTCRSTPSRTWLDVDDVRAGPGHAARAGAARPPGPVGHAA